MVKKIKETPKAGRAKKRPERFKVLKRGPSAHGGGQGNLRGQSFFFMNLIEWKKPSDSLLVTIPRTAGSAVLRNRWKRLVKHWFAAQDLRFQPEQSLWIRFNRTKHLTKPIRSQEWAALLGGDLKKMTPLNPM